MPFRPRSVVLGLFFGCFLLAHFALGDWTTIYGSVRQQARQISSSSLAVPLSQVQWDATVSKRREMWREMLGRFREMGGVVRLLRDSRNPPIRRWPLSISNDSGGSGRVSLSCSGLERPSAQAKPDSRQR